MIKPDFIYTIPAPPENPAPEREVLPIVRELQEEQWKKELGYFRMGTQQYWDSPYSKWKYTDGVKRAAEIFDAWWLVDELCSYPEGEGRHPDVGSSIQFAKITSCKDNSVLEFYDDSSENNQHRVVTWLSSYGEKQKEGPNFRVLFPNKSLPVDQIVFCRQSGVIYLMEEH
jgi:hypothetical protein